VSRNYKIHEQEDLHSLAYATVGWVDVFTQPMYKHILVESFHYCQQAKGEGSTVADPRERGYLKRLDTRVNEP
jgi:hypothetical protein